MSIHTKIQWADSTVNPTTGCDGCELWSPAAGIRRCYAGTLQERRLAKAHPALYAGDFQTVMHGGMRDAERLAKRMAEAARWSDLRGVERLDKPWMPSGLPRLVFISADSDALSKNVPFDYLVAQIIEPVRAWPHFGIWLTKQTPRLMAFNRYLGEMGIAWPDNLMMCVSVTSPATCRRINDLMTIECRWKGLSVEPILNGPIDLDLLMDWRAGVDWVIVGGNSDQAQDAVVTKVEHIHHVIDECDEASVPVFIKQLGSRIDCGNCQDVTGPDWDSSLPPCSCEGGCWCHDIRDSHGGDWSEWPVELRRRHFPDIGGI